MRRLTTIAVCATVLGACGGTSDPATTSPRATSPGATTVDATSGSSPGLPTTVTVVPSATPTTVTAIEPTTTVAPDTTAPATTVPASGLTALSIETPGEQAALDSAAGVDGRSWAAGDPSGAVQAAGDPFLVGYEVRLDDGVTQHMVLVLDGVVASHFGADFGMFDVTSPLTDTTMTIVAATPRQQAAVDAARASIAAVAPDATNGGIFDYWFAFPPTSDPAGTSKYPMVGVVAVTTDGVVFASGGLQDR